MTVWQPIQTVRPQNVLISMLSGAYIASNQFGPANIFYALLGLAIFLAHSTNLLGEDNARTDYSPYVSNQVKGSLENLQTFDNESPRSMKSRDMERDREIAELLPNFRVLKSGTSDRDLKQNAIDRIQKIRLTPYGQQKSTEILDDLSLYRRLPEIRFEIEQDTYDYFIGNPDVVVSMWQAMGITAVDLNRQADYQYSMSHIDGSFSEIKFLKRSPNLNIVYCEGNFQSPFLKRPITAQGLVCINARFEKMPDGTTFVRHNADVFVSFPSLAVETTARLISPISNYIADRNFQEISLFMHSISLSMARQPDWVNSISQKMEQITPEQRKQFQEMTLDVHQAEQKRLAEHFQSDQTFIQRR